MIFILTFYADEQALASLSEVDFNALIERHTAFREEVAARADVIDSRALQPSQTAVTVCPAGDGWSTQPGPAADLAQNFTGFYLVDCADQDAAIELAKLYPMPDGFGCIEVRPVLADWDYAPSQQTAAPSAAVWRKYVDLDSWPRWWHGVTAVELDRPFQSGASGSLSRADGVPVPVRIVDVRDGIGFTTEIDLAPGATLRQDHVLEELPDGRTRVVHRATVPRALLDALGMDFGPELYDGMRQSVAALVADVEAEVGLTDAASVRHR